MRNELFKNNNGLSIFLDIFISSFIFAKQTTYNFSLKCLKDVTVKNEKKKRSKILTVLL